MYSMAIIITTTYKKELVMKEPFQYVPQKEGKDSLGRR